MQNDELYIKFIQDEDFVNYKKPSMFIGAARCDFKCCSELHFPIEICQNSEWAQAPIICTLQSKVIERYLSNPLTESIVFGGLEPLLQINQVYDFTAKLRNEYHCNDTVVIYTGYTKDEVLTKFKDYYDKFVELGNIIIKYGRFILDQEPHYDETLGVNLASDNQYAELVQ